MADNRLDENGFNEKEVELIENNLSKAKEETRYSSDENLIEFIKTLLKNMEKNWKQ